MTKHEIIIGNSNNMKAIPDGTVNLIVTSPPYPMIEMWDEMFSSQHPAIRNDLESGNGMAAFEKMHEVLNAIWQECDRVLADNGFVCINIGDATRTINDNFQLYSNHTQIINKFLQPGQQPVRQIPKGVLYLLGQIGQPLVQGMAELIVSLLKGVPALVPVSPQGGKFTPSFPNESRH